LNAAFVAFKASTSAVLDELQALLEEKEETNKTIPDAVIKKSLGALLTAQSEALKASGMASWQAFAEGLEEESDARELEGITRRWNEVTAKLSENKKEGGGSSRSSSGSRLKPGETLPFAFEGLLLGASSTAAATPRPFHSSELAAASSKQAVSLLVFVRHAG
jgi:hypothetical protein